MIPTVAVFMTKKCPICFELKWRLRVMKFEGIIRLIEVDVNVSRGHDLFDRYRYFVNQALGGSVEVPIVLLVQSNKWFFPRKRSRVGGEETLPGGTIEESVINLVMELQESIKKLRPVSELLPSHECMVEQMIGG